MPTRRHFFIASIFALALLLMPHAASAQTKLRFTLDWIPGATHGAFLLALQKGYYKAEGLDVTIDRGKESAEVVRQLASGAYDMGFPDINVTHTRSDIQARICGGRAGLAHQSRNSPLAALLFCVAEDRYNTGFRRVGDRGNYRGQ